MGADGSSVKSCRWFKCMVANTPTCISYYLDNQINLYTHHARYKLYIISFLVMADPQPTLLQPHVPWSVRHIVTFLMSHAAAAVQGSN